jgi:hypothetical protein
MRPMTILRLMLLGVSAAILVGRTTVASGQQPPASERDSLSDWRYQEGASQTVGSITGTLVCMDAATPGTKATRCAQYGLRPQGKTRIFPLIAGTPEVEKQVRSDAMTNKSVLVVGVEIPETGQIMASGVSLAK